MPHPKIDWKPHTRNAFPKKINFYPTQIAIPHENLNGLSMRHSQSKELPGYRGGLVKVIGIGEVLTRSHSLEIFKPNRFSIVSGLLLPCYAQCQTHCRAQNHHSMTGSHKITISDSAIVRQSFKYTSNSTFGMGWKGVLCSGRRKTRGCLHATEPPLM